MMKFATVVLLGAFASLGAVDPLPRDMERPTSLFVSHLDCRECAPVGSGFSGCGCHQGWVKFVECPDRPEGMCAMVWSCDWFTCFAVNEDVLRGIDLAIANQDVRSIATLVTEHEEIEYRPETSALIVRGCEETVVRELRLTEQLSMKVALLIGGEGRTAAD